MKYKKRNTKFNVDLVYRYIAPRDRSNSSETAMYNSYVFSYCLGVLFEHKTIHNFRNKDKRKNICETLDISDRTYYRYVEEARKHGFLFVDSNNPNILRVTGVGRLVDRRNDMIEVENEKLPKDDKIDPVRHFYKSRLRLNTLKFDHVKMMMDVSLLRYCDYIEDLKRALSIGNHIHRVYKKRTSESDFLLTYEDRNMEGQSVLAKTVSHAYRMLYGVDIEKTVYANSNKKVDGSLYNARFEKQIYSSTLSKSFNSALISVYDFFSVENIDSIYKGDNGSKFKGNAIGYTKSGFNSFMDRAEEHGLLKRTEKFVVLKTSTYDNYLIFKNRMAHYAKSMDCDLTKNVVNRILYKHGCIVMQRENHIKINTQTVKFPWDRYAYAGLVSENADVYNNDRYIRLQEKLGIEGVDSALDLAKKRRKTEKYNLLKKTKIIDSSGRVYSSFSKIMYYKDPEYKDHHMRLVRFGSISYNGEVYKVYFKNTSSKVLQEKKYSYEENI